MCERKQSNKHNAHSFKFCERKKSKLHNKTKYDMSCSYSFSFLISAKTDGETRNPCLSVYDAQPTVKQNTHLSPKCASTTHKQSEFHHRILKTTLKLGQRSESDIPSMLMLVTKTPLIRDMPAAHTPVTHTHRASTEFYLLVTQAPFLPADAVRGCHCVLTGYTQ